MTPWRQHVLAALGDAASLPPPDALGHWLDTLAAEVAARWPEAPLDKASVAQAFARHLRQAPALEDLAAADLLFAALVLDGHPPALTAFDALARAEVRRAVAPLEGGAASVDEVTQLVLERLLVGRPPRLAEYAGLGSLAAWLRAVAVRLALNARRPGAREDAVAEVPDQPLADPDPELALLRGRHRAQFKRAFAEAVGALTPRERTLLRLTTLDGLTLAQVGPMYGKDASTISRWLAAARATLLERTRASLALALDLSSAELDSVMRAADSELDLSISRLLESGSRG